MTQGESGVAASSEYDSTTTRQLTVEETEALLLTLPEIQAMVSVGAAR